MINCLYKYSIQVSALNYPIVPGMRVKQRSEYIHRAWITLPIPSFRTPSWIETHSADYPHILRIVLFVYQQKHYYYWSTTMQSNLHNELFQTNTILLLRTTLLNILVYTKQNYCNFQSMFISSWLVFHVACICQLFYIAPYQILVYSTTAKVRFFHVIPTTITLFTS